MHGLRDLQTEFASALLGNPSDIGLRTRGSGLAPERRIAIYRNNTRLSLTEALRDIFPVVERLVGRLFFDELAQACIRHDPPRVVCLHEYGGGLADLLTTYPPVARLPYLPDVARLEWSCHEAYFAADAQGLDPAELVRVPLACHECLRFVLHPTARLMASSYPIQHIWEVNQPYFAGEDRVDLREGGCHLLILRSRLHVEIHALDSADHALLAALAAGWTIGRALERALHEDQGFDLLTRLHHWLQLRVLTDFPY